MSTINVLVIFETKPESTEIFTIMLDEISQNLPSVEGCHHAFARVCSDNPQRFMIFEEWQSQGAHKAHIDKVIASGTWDDIAKHLATAPLSHYYQPL